MQNDRTSGPENAMPSSTSTGKFEQGLPNALVRLLLGFSMCIFLAGLCVPLAKAQFTYVGADLGYAQVLPLKNVTFVQGNIGIVLQHRPFRNLGIGISINAPVHTVSKVRMPLGKTTGTRSDAYTPASHVHEITRSASVTGFGRFYANMEMNLFVDLRFSVSRMTERVLASRPFAPVENYSDGSIRFPALPSLSLDYSAEHTIYAPGIGIGIMPHITNKLYFTTALHFDGYFFQEPGYSYDVPYAVDLVWNTHEMRKFESPIGGTRVCVNFTVGMGMHF